MTPSAPTTLFYWVGIIAGLLGLIGTFAATLPFVGAYASWLLIVGWLALALGTSMKGM